MNFEQALVSEFSTIEKLNDRVFPLYALEGIKPPFLIYVSSDGNKIQTLGGFTLATEITCEIHVVSMSYAEMKSILSDVLIKIRSFLGRNIGIAGPLIKSVDYEQPTEVFDKSVNYYRGAFDLKVRI